MSLPHSLDILLGNFEANEQSENEVVPAVLGLIDPSSENGIITETFDINTPEWHAFKKVFDEVTATRNPDASMLAELDKRKKALIASLQPQMQAILFRKARGKKEKKGDVC